MGPAAWGTNDLTSSETVPLNQPFLGARSCKLPPIKNSESLHEVGGEVGSGREIKGSAGNRKGRKGWDSKEQKRCKPSLEEVKRKTKSNPKICSKKTEIEDVFRKIQKLMTISWKLHRKCCTL